MGIIDLLNKISKKEFVEYYNNHSLSEVCNYFDISESDSEKLRYWYHCLKYNPQNKFFGMIDSICEQEFRDFYENHSSLEILKMFNIPNKNQLQHLMWYYNLTSTEDRTQMLAIHGIRNQDNQKKILNVQKAKRTKLERYGDANWNNSAKAKQTCEMKYGVSNPMKLPEIKERAERTNMVKYGFKCSAQSPEVIAKAKQTRIEHSGDLKTSYTKAREKQKKVLLEKYGVENYCETDACHKAIAFKKNSSYNNKFASMLNQFEINYQSEFKIGHYFFDFKIGNILVEIDPFSTHNVTWSPFSQKIIDKNYHQHKTECALSEKYRCIHVWDWDDVDKIVLSLLPTTSIYARKCSIVELSKDTTDLFLNINHLQGTCNGQKFCLGLYYDDELVEIMTFGKPRYNSKYQWELLRLCTKLGYNVVGGASKLFKYFVENKNPQSVVSYCDFSKFTGGVYDALGFKLKSKNPPSLHWYRDSDKKHITDNLLRQRGFDQLFGTNYGKGTSNDALMLEAGFVEIYDSGQLTYEWRS